MNQTNAVTRIFGGGEMGELVRAFDWANNPLGPIESWPVQLHAAVEHVLNSGLPLLLLWGPEYIQIYNDGFIQFAGHKHPATLGQNFLTWWPEVGDRLREAIEGARSGRLGLIEDQHFFTDRDGYLEEAFFTYSCSPVHGPEGAIEGLLFSVTETTSKMINSRHTRALLELSAAGLEAQSLADALARSAASLRGAELDVPFALFYQIDHEQRTARLVAATGLTPGTSASPVSVGLNECGWPLAQVLDSTTKLHLDDVQSRFPELTAGPYPEPIRSANVHPILASSGGTGGPSVPVVLVTGMSTRLPLNAAHFDFHDLLATILGHIVASAIAAETRQQQLEALADLNRAKSVFFSNISHEFRTPLTLLLGPLEDELSDQSAPASEPRRARLEIAHRNALRLLKLVNALLDFSSFDAKRMKASFEPVDLAALTRDLAGMFRAAIEAAGLALMVDCRPLPEPIFVDREMWEKIVFNLLSNAFKYTFTGGIRVSLLASGDHVVLEVADSGVGIPAAELPRLFERFHRVRRVRARTQEGSGIGLALVQDIVRLHGGTVRASSEEGKGSCFRVSLRRGSAHLPPEQISTSPPAPSVRTQAERVAQWLPPHGDGPALADISAQMDSRPHILWVEDNTDLRDYVRRLLAPDYAVRAVDDGAKALEAARAERPDLVLTDIMLPGLDGIELVRALRNDPATRSVPVILASARAGQEAAVEGLDAGADDYVVKPFTAGELLARVRSVLALSRARTELATELAHKVDERTAELRQTTAELRRSEEKFQQLTSAINEAFWVTDVATRATLYISPAYERMWGRSRESLYARPRNWLEAVHPDDRGRVTNRADEAGLAGTIFDEEYRIVRPDGEVRWIHGRAFPVRDETGKVYRLAGVAEDVTERKLAEADRLRLQWQLQQSQKLEALGTLTGGIAHDFNNILAAILGNVELVRQDIPPDHIARDSVNEIAAASQRAKELVKRLLSFSRPAEPKRTSFQVHPVLQEAVRLMRAALPAGVELNFDASAQLPPIEGDPSSIHQLALNLVTNAWHALKGNPGRIDIQLAACRVDSTLQQKSPELRAGPYVRLSVSDTGTGIEPEVMNRLFEPFFTTKQQGTGLGLAVVHGIVRAHGGAILVDTAVGRGSTFHVYLPAAASVMQERALSAASSVPHGRGETIMFIDDEPVLVRLARAGLSKLGYLVEGFEKPADALAAFRAHPDSYALIITDYNMPHMSGIELAKQFARIQPSVPIALITGFLRQEEIEQAQSSGIREIILKPIGVDELGPVVGRLLAQSRAREPMPMRL